MKITDIMLFGEAIGGDGGGGGEQSALLRKICESYDIEVLDTDTAEDIEKKAASAIDCWEIDTEDGVDVLGAYTIVSSSSDVTSGDTVLTGVARLKKDANLVITSSDIPPYFGLDMSNASDTLAIKSISCTLIGVTKIINMTTGALSRVILPEVYPHNPFTGQLIQFGSCPGKIYLSKHTFGNKTLSNLFSGASYSCYKEEILIAPKDMDAQWHLNKFTKMSAETIVGILENLADVTDRGTPYTLTLGSTNLAKITEEQKNIAYAKGWNLA